MISYSSEFYEWNILRGKSYELHLIDYNIILFGDVLDSQYITCSFLIYPKRSTTVPCNICMLCVNSLSTKDKEVDVLFLFFFKSNWMRRS